jgi:hypothetical protein
LRVAAGTAAVGDGEPNPRRRYDWYMAKDLEPTRSRPPILKKAAAGIVLVIAAALVLKLLIGFVVAIFWVAVVVAVIAAVLWAVKTIVW